MKRPHFVAISTATMPDPRIRRHNGNHQRCIVVTQLLDKEGYQWERFADEPPTRLVNGASKVKPKPRR